MKKCATCGEIKPLSEFHSAKVKGRDTNTHKPDCKICYREKKRNRDKAVNEEYDKWFKSIPKCCERCGETRPYVIDFHHVNPILKETEVSQIRGKSWKLETKIKKAEIEMDKCIQLCSNCHREFHHLERHSDISIDEYL